MNKMAKIFIILMLAIALGSPAASAKNGQAKESLVALGDSITFGYNLGQNNRHPAKAAYPHLIGAEENWRVRNLGITGWESGELLNALQNDQKYRQAVRHADYVTVTIGSNDLIQLLQEAGVLDGNIDPSLLPALLENPEFNAIFLNITLAITEIRALTDAPIVVYNIYNPFQLVDTRHYVADILLPVINSKFEFLTAASEGVYLADAYSAFGDSQSGYVIYGDVHPNAAGQQVLAEIGVNAFNQD